MGSVCVRTFTNGAFTGGSNITSSDAFYRQIAHPPVGFSAYGVRFSSLQAFR
ncbi:MAG: hypothetical protein AVDCRST_MAG86-1714 [uncultured Truepera sp.]|uniref:Uncharacterized protein n=1 Tax=uncultured Truepera sp. TaxID=543023 RepID=A0A6J4VA33_9DEIN|nr:MAG: hypothetical protein AVDCRST_MAG86-1714 [uncultured Truepera sp.]